MPDVERSGFANDDVDDRFTAELRQMWQDGSRSPADGVQQLTRRLDDRVRRFDRTVFWRNVVEYGAGTVVLTRSVMEIAAAGRPNIVPLASIVVVLFILAYLWRAHRGARALDRTANVRTYQTALLDRFDAQIRLAGSIRYWYVLPVWLILVALLVHKVLSGLAVMPSVAEFVLTSFLCGVVIWYHEARSLPRLRQERDSVASLIAQSER